MLKKLLKILFVVVAMWIVSLLTIVREHKFGNKILLSEKEQKSHYKQALDKLKNKINFETDVTSDFDAWHQLPEINVSISSDEKMSIIRDVDIPPGKQGRPVVLDDNLRRYIKNLIHQGWEDHAFNQFVSDLIPVNRSLTDARDDWCKNKIYRNDLPQVSVVICFHNEGWSTLLRTVNSIINRSPNHLLKEVILIDDFSTMDHLKKPLDEYVHSIPMLMLRRTRRREGLIRSRILGVQYVTAPIVMFLDSHCECNYGWLEPLVERIAENSTRVVSPIIDHIHDSTFEYIAQDINNLQIGGFNWDLIFKWKAISRDVLLKRKNPAAPIETPTISGGLFAIDKRFFEKLGYYDDGYEIWGAENLELSFKAWMCGGSLEIVPCSHVGHVFRKRIPYKGQKGSLRRNSIRLAEVWLDEYAKYYYMRIGNDKGKVGDVSKRKELRKKLQCKTFEWYLKNVYPELEIPGNYVASGQIYSLSNYGMCLDASSRVTNMQRSVLVLPCHFQGGNQYWIYTKDGEIKRDEMCLDYLYNSVIIFLCRGRMGSQTWLYDSNTKNIRHFHSQKCLQLINPPDGLRLVLVNCLTSLPNQKWMMQNYSIDRLSPELQIYVNKEG